MIAPFSLEIEFCGLCLLVKHGNKLHVLMPSAEASGYEQHLPRAYYPGGPATGQPISGKTIEFLTSGATTDLTFQPGFENVSALWKEKPKVDRDLINKPINTAILAARVVVSSGKIDTVGGAMGFWDTVPDSSDASQAPAKAVAFATSVFWRTEVNDTSLKPVYDENGSYKQLFDVTPSGSGPLKVEIRHVIAGEHGPKAGMNLPTTPHPHLSAYFPLFKKKKGPGLKFKSVMLQQKGVEIVPPGVSPFSCMTIGGE